jgi:hypothetical protein
MRPVAFGEALSAGTRLTLFSDDKPDRFFIVIKFWMDKTLGASLALTTTVPSYQVEDEEGRIHLLIHRPIEEQHEHRWCLWRLDHAGFDSRSIFEAALAKELKCIEQHFARSRSMTTKQVIFAQRSSLRFGV